MGRKNTQYKKSLHQQAYDTLTGMLALGESKRTAMATDTAKDKIYSRSTYRTYMKHVRYFIRWLREEHPEVSTLKRARRYAADFLAYRAVQNDEEGNPLYSAWTIQTEAAALNKLYQIDKSDPGRFQPPKRERGKIKRSRIPTEKDRHFSVTNNAELVQFCSYTGCRRNILEKLEGRDFWPRERMEAEITFLQGKENTTDAERTQLANMQEALRLFPEYPYFLHHRRDKGGRSRFAPILNGPGQNAVVGRMLATPPDRKVWAHVHSGADVHGLRAQYCTELYRSVAQDVENLPYDKVNKGSGQWYQSGVYVCRGDQRGLRLSRRGLYLCSKALGHNRESVTVGYLRNL